MLGKKELRKEMIRSKIDRIVDSVNFIEENLPSEFEDFDNRILKNAIYKELEFAIENIIDICSIINSDLRLGSPETEDSIVEHLERRKILDKAVLESIKEIKRFRNILIHKYGEIDDKMAFGSIQDGLKDFSLIIKEIEEFLDKN